MYLFVGYQFGFLGIVADCHSSYFSVMSSFDILVNCQGVHSCWIFVVSCEREGGRGDHKEVPVNKQFFVKVHVFPLLQLSFLSNLHNASAIRF